MRTVPWVGCGGGQVVPGPIAPGQLVTRIRPATPAAAGRLSWNDGAGAWPFAPRNTGTLLLGLDVAPSAKSSFDAHAALKSIPSVAFVAANLNEKPRA